MKTCSLDNYDIFSMALDNIKKNVETTAFHVIPGVYNTEKILHRSPVLQV